MKLPNSKKHLLYIKVTKTGSMSMLNFLRRSHRLMWDHTIPQYNRDFHVCYYMINPQIHEFCNAYPDYWNNAYKFAFVRNPYDRAISGYNYVKKNYNITCSKSSALTLDDLLLHMPRPLVPWPTGIFHKRDVMRAHLRSLPKEIRDAYSAYQHFTMTQTEGLSMQGKLFVDKVLHLENIDEELGPFLHDIGITEFTGLPHININAQSQKQQRAPLTRKQEKLIEEHFSDDFNNFGYDRRNN